MNKSIMPNQTARPAVLLLAHGTPNTLGEMADYLRLVTGGRPLPESVIQELQHRYAQIGLRDTAGEMAPPLTHWTLVQRELLEALLARDGNAMPVYAAMRNWHPLISDVVRQIRADGITQLTALCLAPQNSRTSIGLYRRALLAALESTSPGAGDDPLSLTFVDAWAEEPKLIAAFAERLTTTYARASEEVQGAVPVLFTAHSVPCRTIMSSDASVASPAREASLTTTPQIAPDPYPVEAKRTAGLVFEQAFHEAGVTASKPPEWFFAFQSQGVAGGPWIGPTVEESLAAIAGQGYRGVVLQPIGFVCDHVEILYDIDIAFQEVARGLGLRLFRPDSLNGSSVLTQAIVNVLHKTWRARREQPAAEAQQFQAVP